MLWYFDFYIPQNGVPKHYLLKLTNGAKPLRHINELFCFEVSKRCFIIGRGRRKSINNYNFVTAFFPFPYNNFVNVLLSKSTG